LAPYIVYVRVEFAVMPLRNHMYYKSNFTITDIFFKNVLTTALTFLLEFINRQLNVQHNSVCSQRINDQCKWPAAMQVEMERALSCIIPKFVFSDA
jgi:hypothetical protein